MIQLVTTDQILTRLMMPSIPESVSKVIDKIVASHLAVQSRLDTKLDKKVAVVDIFKVDSAVTLGVIPDGLFRLRLRNGFVRTSAIAGAADPVVTCGYDVVSFSDFLPFDQTSTYWNIDHLHGIVNVPKAIEGQYVKVVYDSGFEVVANVVTPAPPDELIEAIIAYVPIVMEFSANNTSVGGRLADQNKREAAERHFLSILSSLFRPKALSLTPINP